MIKTAERIEREVEATLSGLGQKARLTARPDFDARLQARIRDEESGRGKAPTPIFRRRLLVPAAAALVLALNIVTAVLVFRKADSAPAVRQKAMATLAEEFSLKTSSSSSYWE